MLKFMICVHVVGLLVFGSIHALMFFGGSSDTEIQNVLLGWLFFAAFCAFFSGGWHGGGVPAWLAIMVPVSLACGANIMAINQPLLAVILTGGINALVGWIIYQNYLDTPYEHGHRPVRNIPGFGAVVMEGATPRIVADKVRALKRKHKTK